LDKSLTGGYFCHAKTVKRKALVKKIKIDFLKQVFKTKIIFRPKMQIKLLIFLSVFARKKTELKLTPI